MAYSLYATRKLGRANTFTAQALNLNPNDIEATILRGNILIEQKKYQDALFFFRHAVQLKPYRYEPHKGLVDCLVGMHRLREAINIASGSCKQLGHTTRVLTVVISINCDSLFFNMYIQFAIISNILLNLMCIKLGIYILRILIIN